MKKLLVEYANIIGYTVTGLIFGLAFFLLFINFYHYQEVNTLADVSIYNAAVKTDIEEKLQIIENNISVYDQTTYQGNLNIYGLNTVKIKLQACLDIMRSEEFSKYFDMTEISMLDSYHFTIDFRNKILNDCLVMQVKSMFGTDTVALLPNYSYIKPYVDINIATLIETIEYTQGNLENSDHYYFTTDGNRNNFFDLAKDSYIDIANKYQTTLDLLVEVSSWYKNLVIGG